MINRMLPKGDFEIALCVYLPVIENVSITF